MKPEITAIPGKTACARCGACLPACPVYRVSGREDLSPRGRMRLIGLGLDGGKAQKAISACLLCGACEAVCSRGLDITGIITAAREGIKDHIGAGITTVTSSPPRLRGAIAPMARMLARAKEFLPRESGPGLKPEISDRDLRSSRPPVPGKTLVSATVTIFSGCFAAYLVPEILAATSDLVRLTDNKDPHIPKGQHCCGLAAKGSGHPETARELARRNIETFNGTGPILTPCASCCHQLRQYPALLDDDPRWRERAIAFAARVREFSSFFTVSSRAGTIKTRLLPLESPLELFCHDPCHLRFFGRDLTRESRELLALVPGLVLNEFSHGPSCCGLGGSFGIRFPGLSRQIIEPAIRDIKESKAAMLTTSCSGCLLQWQRRGKEAGLDLEVIHPAIILARLLRR